MKKYLGISLLLVLCLTGCKNTLTCTLKQSEEDYDVNQKMIYNVGKDGKVQTANSIYTMTFKDENSAKKYYSILGTLNEDYDIEQKKNKIIMKDTQDYKSNNQTKSELKSSLEKSGYSCK